MNKGKYDLFPEQLALVNKYCEDELRLLKKICLPLIAQKGVAEMEYDDLIDDAMKVLLETASTYNKEINPNFGAILTMNIKRSYIDWTRDRMRDKSVNYARDKNGNIIKDEDGNKIILQSVILDATTEEGRDVSETVASNFNIESESQFDFDIDEKVEDFLDSLSKVQKSILLMRMEKIEPDNIKKKLNLSDREYNNEMKSIKMNKGLSVFTKNKNDGNYNMEVKEMAERIIEISESENYRTDKFTMYSLLEDKKRGDINCKYILQREPFQWTSEEANRYFCRILSNLPIPEIIICEQKKKGLTISHLIDGLQRLSYAESFKENRTKIGVAGAERHLIQYRDYVLDENGNRVLDEDGLPEYEMKVFDVIGKCYADLPDELKKRFNNFNINVTKFFDCTDEQIADHIRDYNNHASMNKEQGGLLNVSAHTAGYIKNISQKNTFFKNCGKFTDNSKIKGKVERVIAESIMLLFFRDNWKANLDSIYKFVNENATEQQFLKLNSDFNRLELALGENNKELKGMFTPTTMPMWISVFDKFTTYNIEDSRFVDFLNTYNTNLKDKEIDGISMADFKDQQTKKKATIIGKIDLLVKLMNEYLHIESTENVDDTIESTTENISEELQPVIKLTENNINIEETPLKFIRENVKSDADEEDIKDYDEYLDNIVRVSSPIYQKCKIALLALTAYVYTHEQDEEFAEWLEKYQNEKTDFSDNQTENYIYILDDFENYMRVHKEGQTNG